MLSKTQSKYIRSLSQQKYRNENKVFLAEGDKIAQEWLSSERQIQMIVAVVAWVSQNEALISKHAEAELVVVSDDELKKVSSLQTANNVLLVVEKEVEQDININDGWSLALDRIQDPGNMGTIIRIADWFGIKNVIASADSVDFYNPKVVQAAMGGHVRVGLYTRDLMRLINDTTLTVYAATLDGDSIYAIESQESGILLIGNESKGVSPELIKLANKKITIPRKGGAESLNAAVSTGILAAMLTGR